MIIKLPDGVSVKALTPDGIRNYRNGDDVDPRTLDILELDASHLAATQRTAHNAPSIATTAFNILIVVAIYQWAGFAGAIAYTVLWIIFEQISKSTKAIIHSRASSVQSSVSTAAQIADQRKNSTSS